MVGMMCSNCANFKDKHIYNDVCKSLFNKIDCFLHSIHEDKFISVPNGSTGIALAEQIYNILRHYSTEENDSEGEDVHIPKPCDIFKKYVEKRNSQDV